MYRTQHQPRPTERRRLAPGARFAIAVLVLLALAVAGLVIAFFVATSQCSAFGGSCP